jgi:hypothetical protein
MADQKITQLPELTAPTADDLLVVVDDAAGTPVTKRVRVDAVLALGGGGGGGTTGALAYDWSTTTTAPPTSSQIRADALHPYTALTTLWLRYTGTDGVNYRNLLMLLVAGQRVYVQDKDDAAAYLLAEVTGAPVDNVAGAYVTVPAALLQAGTTLNNNQAVTVHLGAAAGDGAGADEVHIGATEPTDPGIELWVDTSEGEAMPQVLDRSRPNITVTNTATPTDVYTLSIPGGTLGTAGYLRLTLLGNKLKNGGGVDTAMLMSVYYGAALVLAVRVPSVTVDSATVRYCDLTLELRANGATNAQLGHALVSAQTGAPGETGGLNGSRGTAAVDSTVAQTLRVTWTQAATALHAYTSESALVELW